MGSAIILFNVVVELLKKNVNTPIFLNGIYFLNSKIATQINKLITTNQLSPLDTIRLLSHGVPFFF